MLENMTLTVSLLVIHKLTFNKFSAGAYQSSVENKIFPPT